MSVLNVTAATHAIPFVFAIYIAVVSYMLNLPSEYEVVTVALQRV